MSLADRLDATWARASAVFEEAFASDDYEIRRAERTADGRGGSTEHTVIDETGKCSLDVDTNRSGEQQVGDRITTRSSYLVTIYQETGITTKSDLYVNGRHFNVLDVKRGGDWATETQVWAEELL